MLQLSPPFRRLLDPRTQWRIKDLQNFFSRLIENQRYNKTANCSPRWCTCIQVVPVSKEKWGIKIPWINLHIFCVRAPLKNLTLLYNHFHNQPLPYYGWCLAVFLPRDTSLNYCLFLGKKKQQLSNRRWERNLSPNSPPTPLLTVSWC